MDSHDKRLGMDREISRRDFLNGVGVAIGASLVPACARNEGPVVGATATYYPPIETGMRGFPPRFIRSGPRRGTGPALAG